MWKTRIGKITFAFFFAQPFGLLFSCACLFFLQPFLCREIQYALYLSVLNLKKLVCTFDPYKSIPVGSQSGFVLGPLSRISPALPKTRATVYIVEVIFRDDLYRSSICAYGRKNKSCAYAGIPLEIPFIAKHFL